MRALFSILVLLSFSTFLCAQENEDCLECHSETDITKFVNDTTEVSVYVDNEILMSSIHSDMSCVDCHQGTEEHPDEMPLPKVNCADCHDDSMEEYAESVHAKGRSKPGVPTATCASCHGSHDIKPADEEDSRVHTANISATCDECHSQPEVLQQLGKKGQGPTHGYLAGVHGKSKTEDPDGDAPVCSDCHGYHKILPRTHPDCTYSKQNVAQTCGTCHEEESEEYNQSIHALAIERGHYEAPTCNDCHNEHQVSAGSEKDGDQDHLSHDTKVCQDCHASEVMMNRYGLDNRRFDSYLKSYHGLAAIQGSPDAATCTACHETHSIRSSSDSLSSVHLDNRTETCGQCHENITAEFAQIEMHPVDQESRNPIAYIFKMVYTWMLVVVIGGMIVHNIIIFVFYIRQRRKALKGMIRVQRFQPWEVYQHMLMFLSFTILAITGFALKFPDAAWVKVMYALGMSEPLRALIHRISAIVMIAISLIQGFYLLFTKSGRKELMELIPTSDDLVHVFQNMAYYLGFGKSAPRFPRFDYAEKAEYLALIWGVIVMAATGFILWFPEVFIGIFPFWLFETAEVVHYYEAWLATLAILVWHWFFVILHPEKYPLSLTWMDGKISEEEFKHHHPLEYEKLKAAQQKAAE